MTYTAIDLQLRQVEEAFSRSRINVYSDKRKEKHYKELYDLYLAINKVNFKGHPLLEIESNYALLEFILNGLEYLDGSTLNSIPYEIVSCLEYALKEWIEDKNFIIVTSLSNKHLQYLFHTFLNAELFNNYNQYIKSRYNLTITDRLVRITLPKSLSRDYLSSVVLYHELGHFIDDELAVSQKILLKRTQEEEFENTNRELHHSMEYFADLFAAQYVDRSVNMFIQHITPSNRDVDSETHPSTSKRVEVVEQFLNNQNSPILEEFNLVLTTSNNQLLKIRHSIINSEKSNFNNLIPQEINSELEIHAIFRLAWEVWLNSESNFLKDLDNKQSYKVINNLVEKSISNYTILEKWQSGGVE